MAQRGNAYAGECANTSLKTDIGKFCSTQCIDRGDQKIYGVGRTFSEYSTWLLVQRRDGGWLVVATAKHDGTTPPPW
jgi:hypothetical protein